MKHRVEFFTQKEFTCPCCGGGRPASMLVYSLEELRRAWTMPIIINSAWRCPGHNAEVGGVPNSRHLLGLAADIRPHKPELIGPFQTLVGAMFGRREGWELRLYPRFVHIAVPRGEESRLWAGNSIEVKAA